MWRTTGSAPEDVRPGRGLRNRRGPHRETRGTVDQRFGPRGTRVHADLSAGGTAPDALAFRSMIAGDRVNTETLAPGAAPANPLRRAQGANIPDTDARADRPAHAPRREELPSTRARSCRARRSAPRAVRRSLRQHRSRAAHHAGGEQLIVVVEPGGFTGEMSTLRGVGSLVRARVREDGEVLAIPDDQLRTVVQTDARLSELFMRAFILRRVALVAAQQGDVSIDRLASLRRHTARPAVPVTQRLSVREPRCRHRLRACRRCSIGFTSLSKTFRS